MHEAVRRQRPRQSCTTKITCCISHELPSPTPAAHITLSPLYQELVRHYSGHAQKTIRNGLEKRAVLYKSVEHYKIKMSSFREGPDREQFRVQKWSPGGIYECTPTHSRNLPIKPSSCANSFRSSSPSSNFGLAIILHAHRESQHSTPAFDAFKPLDQLLSL